MYLIRSIRRILFTGVLPAVSGMLIVFVLGAHRAMSVPSAPFDQNTQQILASCVVTGALEGVDVSEYAGTISWTQVAQTKAFAYSRARDGVTLTDTTFLTNYAHIKNAGMKAGAYLFFEPAQDPVQQANLFVAQLRQAGFVSGDLAPAIDVEVTGGQISTTITDRLQIAISIIENSFHITPAIYTGPAGWNAGIGSPAFGADPLWVANWGVTCPSLPVGWNAWAIWQYADTGIVPGIVGTVDLDRSNGSVLPIYTGTEYSLYLPLVIR